MVLNPILLGAVWFIIHRYSVFPTFIWRGWVGGLSQMKLTSFEKKLSHFEAIPNISIIQILFNISVIQILFKLYLSFRFCLIYLSFRFCLIYLKKFCSILECYFLSTKMQRTESFNID